MWVGVAVRGAGLVLVATLAGVPAAFAADGGLADPGVAQVETKTTKAAPPAAGGIAGPAGFGVEPWINTRKTRALDHLIYGLPAFIAERLATGNELRLASLPELFPRVQPATVKYLVGGRFERGADWKVTVTVDIQAAGFGPRGGEVIASASRSGATEAAATLALEAAVAAFAAVPGLNVDAAAQGAAHPVRFARDPYAFVLYGRGLAALHGQGAPAARLERSRKHVMRSLVIDPKVPETRRLLAELYLAAGKPGHARAALTSTLELRPEYVAALRALGALDRAAKIPAARASLERALALDPHDQESRRLLGELYAEAGELGPAQKLLERVLAAQPEDLQARRSLVLVLAARQAGEELVVALEEIVRLDPDNVDARMDLGAAYMSEGRNADAASTYEDVLRRRPRHAAALKLTADLARERGDVAQASARYTRLRLLSPGDPRPLFLLASTHADAGNIDLAERFFSAGLAYPAVRADALSNLGALAMQRGADKQALGYLSRAAKLRPDRSTIRFNHAVALHRVGRHVSALGELQAAASLTPHDPGVHFFSGVVALRLGLLAEAMRSFEETLAIDPKHGDARHNLELLTGPSLRREGVLTFAAAPATTTIQIVRAQSAGQTR